MASHLAPSSPTQRTRSGQLLSQEGSVLRLPEQAAWKWHLQEGVCHVPSTGSSQQHRASAGRSSPSPSRALRGTCELPARMDLHTGHELKRAFNEFLQQFWIDKMTTLKAKVSPKSSSKDNPCRTQRNPAPMTLKEFNTHDKHRIAHPSFSHWQEQS